MQGDSDYSNQAGLTGSTGLGGQGGTNAGFGGNGSGISGMGGGMGGTGGGMNQTGQMQGSGGGDLLDKGVNYAENRSGHPQSRSTTEKISDAVRTGVKKVTGEFLGIIMYSFTRLTNSFSHKGKDVPIKDKQY
ncbi:hypothetical protein Clacol_003204 [Clathrus columnatus]|uniref:Uncharacterized protein n=1 Tax=Clathrus columnatus TaxID=1419009 RepID=A0AAV5A8K3_9AGAM|nr:hypothetical protein Clacol_003204 [Clathrus columnatus]